MALEKACGALGEVALSESPLCSALAPTRAAGRGVGRQGAVEFLVGEGDAGAAHRAGGRGRKTRLCGHDMSALVR